MVSENISEIIAKLRYQVLILGQAIDSEQNPVESMIVSYDWGPRQLDRAHEIFERWDQRLESGGIMCAGEFESDFAEELEVSYQGLKGIIRAFYKNGQWSNVCEAYVDSFGGAPAIEYHSIMRRER